MAIIRNDHETNTHVMDNLKSLGFSHATAYEVINTISAVDKIKDNLGITELTIHEKDKIKFQEAIYSEGSRYFYTYLQHTNPSQFHINKAILQKYKSNICKYIYILASDTNRLDYSEQQTIKDNLPIIKWAEKILQFMERFETNILGKRKDALYMRERKSLNTATTVTRGANTVDKVDTFFKSIVDEGKPQKSISDIPLGNMDDTPNVGENTTINQITSHDITINEDSLLNK